MFGLGRRQEPVRDDLARDVIALRGEVAALKRELSEAVGTVESLGAQIKAWMRRAERAERAVEREQGQSGRPDAGREVAPAVPAPSPMNLRSWRYLRGRDRVLARRAARAASFQNGEDDRGDDSRAES